MVQPEILTTEQAIQGLILKPLRDRSGLNAMKFVAGEYLIGSAPDCDYVLTCDGIASQHCKLKFDGIKAIIQSIDSRTWINDTPVTETSIRKGDRLSVGPVNFVLDAIEPITQSTEPSTANQNDQSLPSGEQVLQYLQRAISHGQIEPSALQQLNPEACSSPLAPVDQALEELNQSLRQTQKQHSEHEQELARMASVSSEACVESEPTPSEKNTGQEIQSLQQHIEQLKDQISNQKQAQKDQEVLLSGKETEIQQLKESLAFSEKEWQESLSAKMHSDRERQEKEQELLFQQADFNRQMKTLEEEIATLNEQKEANALENNLAFCEREWQESLNAKIQADRERQEQEHEFLFQQADFDRQVKSFEEDLAAFNEQKEAQEQKLAQLEQQLQEARKHLEEKEKQYQTEKTDWEGREEQLNANTEKHEQFEQEALREKNRLEDQLKAIEQQSAEIHEQKASREQQLSDAQQQLEDKEEQIQKEKADWEDLKRTLSEDVEKLQQREQELLTLQDQANQAREDVVEELTSLKDSLVQEQDRAESLQLSLDQLQTQKQQQASEKEEHVAELMQEVNEKMLKIAAEKEVIEAVREEVELEKEAFSQTRKDLQEVREQAEHEMQNLHRQREDLDQQQEELELSRNAISQNDTATEVENKTKSEQSAETPDDQNAIGNSEDSLLPDSLSETSKPETVEPLAAENFLEADQEEAIDTVVTDSLDSSLPEVASSEPLIDNEELLGSEAPRDVEQNEVDDIEDLHNELAQMFGMNTSEPETDSDQNPQGDELLASEDSLLHETSIDSNSFSQGIEPGHDDHLEEYEAELSELSAAINELMPEEDPVVSSFQNEEKNEPEVALDDANDPDSISAYMKDLFARTGNKQNYSEPEINQKTDQQKQDPEPKQSLQTTSDFPETINSSEQDEQLPVVPVKEISNEPIASVDRNSMVVDIASLREVANQTAHNALSTHAGKQLHVKVMINSILTVATGVASAVLLAAPLWGAHTYRDYGMISILLCIVSAIELFRANMMLVRLKPGANSSGETSQYDKKSDQE